MNTTRFSIFDFIENAIFRNYSLRAKLILGNILITFVAIVGMGYYVYFRAQESNTALANQLGSNVRTKAEETLSNISREQAAVLDNFFAAMSKNTSVIAAIEKNMLSKQNTLYNAAYWDAAVSLARLPSGSWDNSNDEIASVFIPAKVELTDSLASKINIVKQTELIVPSIFKDNPDIIAIYFGGTTQETIYYPNIDLANIVPPDFDVTGRPWFVAAAPAQNPDGNVVWSTPYQDAALNGLVITSSSPVVNSRGVFQGVAAMDIQLNRITDIVGNIHIGKTGYAFLIDNNNRLIALPPAGYADFGVTADTLPAGEVLDQTKLSNASPELFDLLKLTALGNDGVEIVKLAGTERYVAYQGIPEVQYKLIVIAPSEELLAESTNINAQVARESTNTIWVSVILVALIIAFASVATLVVGNRLTTPLESLTSVAKEITAGNYEARAQIKTRDEIGVLSETINTMSMAIKDSITSLEERVNERTVDLQRRTLELETITDVAREISIIRNLDTLLNVAVNLIRDRFRYNHVGIFLTDERSEYSVLRAASGDAAQKLLDQGYKLKIGEVSLIGTVTRTGQSYIALDTRKDSIYLENPFLPNTRSELVLPLRARSMTIGVLDIQSNEPSAFDERNAQIIQLLADQLAAAIENAQLVEQVEETLKELNDAYRLQTRTIWQAPNEGKGSSFEYDGLQVQPTPKNLPNSMLKQLEGGKPIVFRDTIESSGRKTASTLMIPLLALNQLIGVIGLEQEDPNHIWTDEEMAIAEAAANRAALTLENARLLEESQRRATKERTIFEATARIGSALNMENILQITAEELERVLGNSEVTIQLQGDAND